MFTTILVAIDSGPPHAQVLALAASLATPHTRLHLLCVLDPAFALADDAPPADRTEYVAADAQRQQAMHLLTTALDQLRERGHRWRGQPPGRGTGPSPVRLRSRARLRTDCHRPPASFQDGAVV